MEITAAAYPQIFEAFEAISHDSGFSAGHKSYHVPACWADRIPSIETVLAGMDPEQREHGFVLGEGTEVEALVASRPELAPAHALLNAFFEDFHAAE
ncbi:MAG TPA: hypothetical protein VEA44_16165 [Caulobacter sp.]|nr:hypothetical protein [Caulobacter sp.]